MIITIKALKNPAMAPHFMGLIKTIAKLIWAGIILLIISGIAYPYVMPSYWSYEYSTVMMVKHVFVVLLIILTIAMLFVIVPKIVKIAPKEGEKPSKKFMTTKNYQRIVGLIIIILWYLIIILSVIN